ncbi:hypothetical protein F5Y19DRAFT_468605 [Xylariaceae sp. FL1651]|nr:hypothetical protein F5Y19DRAFT_468605 [Xylariaceae sp. FL1651]
MHICSFEALKPLPEEARKRPWKYVGYRRYAQYLASDDDLLIFRRFRVLNTRVALLLQDRITALEKRLQKLDDAYNKSDEDPINNGAFGEDTDDRDTLMNEIIDNLDRYNKFLIQQSSLREYMRAPPRDIQSLRTWHENHPNITTNEEEHSYLREKQDLIRMRLDEKTPLRRWIDNSSILRALALWRKRSQIASTDETENVSYYSNAVMDFFASAIIFTIGGIIIVMPIWVLLGLNGIVDKVGAITVFIVAFLAVLSFVLVAKPFEVLGATAAYAAVLVVFLQVQVSADSW